MNHLRAVNRKAVRVERATDHDVVALQRNGLPQGAAFPIGCSLVFSPGWEADSHGRHGGIVPAGRARPVRLSHRLLLAGAGTRPVLITRPTGRRNAPPPRRTGAGSISFSRDHHEKGSLLVRPS